MKDHDGLPPYDPLAMGFWIGHRGKKGLTHYMLSVKRCHDVSPQYFFHMKRGDLY